ncbi:MAG: hypothetical protein ACO25F_08530 [Erythrobacter sp.]
MTANPDLLPGPGEARTRQRSRRMTIFYSASAVLGFALGFGLANVEQGEGNFLTGDIAALTLDPAIAVIVALGFFVGLMVLPVWGFTQIDEHQARNNLISMAAGCQIVLAGYPVWAVLAMGGLLPLPGAFGIWLLAFLAMAVTFGVLKLRG